MRTRELWAFLAMSCVACGSSDDGGDAGRTDVGALDAHTALDGAAGATDGSALHDAGSAADASVPSTSNAIPFGDGRDVCAGALAEDVFRYALLGCDDLRFVADGNDAPTTIDGFDSQVATYAATPGTQRGGAPIGTAGQLTMGHADISGTVTHAAASTESLAFFQVTGGNAMPVFRVRGDLLLGGDLQLGVSGTTGEEPRARVVVDRDLRLVGSIDTQEGMASGDGIDVARDAHLSPSSATPSGWPLRVTGNTVREAVSIDPLCACGAAGPVAFVTEVMGAAATRNDNAARSFSAASLEGSGPLTLPAGRLYLDGDVVVSRPWVVTGRTSLYVRGGLDVRADVRVEGDGLLDVFVTGSVGETMEMGCRLDTASTTFGSVDHPSRVRLYCATTVELGATTVGAMVAGRSILPFGSGALPDLYGALVGSSVSFNGRTGRVHYDRSVLRTSRECGSAVRSDECESDCDCSGGARCSSGLCLTSCTSDRDCVAPLVCGATSRVCEELLL